MSELQRMKKSVERLLKDTTDTKSNQSTTSTLLKDQEKKISTLSTTLNDTNTQANTLTNELRALKTSLEAKLDEILSSSVGRTRRAGSFESPSRPSGPPGSDPSGEGRGQNGSNSRNPGGRATNTYS